MANIPTEIEESQAKELLSRTEVRTMRKDLQKLREGVALKERERIVKLKTPEEEKREAEKVETPEKEVGEKQGQATTEVFERKSEKEREAMTQLKNFATEEEKQKIFYLESEKTELEKQLQTIQKEKEPPLLLQKNKLLLERKETEESLKVFLEKEKEIENEQKFINESEGTTSVPRDKQKLEKKRWQVEGEREGSEKKRWKVEKDLERIENQTKSIDDEYQKVLAGEKVLNDKIEEINNSLKSVYAGIIAKEEEKKRMRKEQKDIESLKQAEVESKRKEEIRRQEWKGRGKVEEKPFLRGIPEGGGKEKLVKKMQEGAVKEAEERKKFLESIEKWAEESPSVPKGTPAPEDKDKK